MKNRFFVLFLILNSTIFFGQFKFDINDSIKVNVGANELKYPWCGGLNYVQFSDIDYDFDGDLDLFIFDRTKDNIRLFENVLFGSERKYVFVQNAAQFFPSDFKYRVALLDYNGDGKNDAFIYGTGGVKVYKNIGNETDGLKWEVAKDLLYSDYNGNYSNLYVSSTDIPAYSDIDFDGDIDILTFNLSGETVEYHKNKSQEIYNHSDSLIFELKNECWGKFKEDPISFNVILNNQTSPCVDGAIDNPEMPIENSDKKLRHAGSTLLIMDYDNSGVMDLILGDVSSGNLNLLINGGTAPNTNSEMISQDHNFPSSSIPVNLMIFPAAFFIDVDFDGIKDLIVGANAKNSSQNVESIHFYKNFGSNSIPNFVFQTNSFLQENMIDVGNGAIPLFFDQNGDGLDDLFIANFFRYKEPLEKESNVTNFRNTGTLNQAVFSYVESDFLNFTSQNYGLRTVPTFGDVDADGDKDLILGLENGTLVFYENTAGIGNQAFFSSPVTDYKDDENNVISAGAYAFPQLFDLNNDDLMDLIIGKKTGEIAYYQNIGTSNNPSFKLMNDTLGKIDLTPLTPDGYAAPHFFRQDDTTYLLLGSSSGKLEFYKQIDGHLTIDDEFNLVSDFFRQISVESYSSCWVNDLDNDGNLDLYVGGDLGGIVRYEHNDNSSLFLVEKNTLNDVKISPNPFTNELKINLNEIFYYEFFDILGEVKLYGISTSSTIHTEILKSGFYYLKIKVKNNCYTFKVVKKL